MYAPVCVLDVQVLVQKNVHPIAVRVVVALLMVPVVEVEVELRVARPVPQVVRHVPIHVMVVVEWAAEETVVVHVSIMDLPQLQPVFNKYRNGV